MEAAERKKHCALCHTSAPQTLHSSLFEILVMYAKTHSAEMENIINAWQGFMGDSLLYKCEE